MKRLSVSPLFRAFAVFGLVASLVTGITFAALQDQATLTNNTIASATTSLDVKSSGSFAAQDAGFAFTGVVPGGSAVPSTPFDFQLRNSGDVDLEIAVSIPSTVTWTTDPVTETVDNTKVFLTINCASDTTTESFTLFSDVATLASSHATGGITVTGDNIPQTPDNIFSCGAQVSMDTAAFNGASASSDNFNITFWGTVPAGP